MKAQTFQIKGESKFLSLMAKDLEDSSYGITYGDRSGRQYIGNNTHTKHIKDKNNFKILFYGETLVAHKEYDVVFVLPQDYNAALEFAKAQLDDKLWKEEFKYGEVIKTSLGDIAKIIGETSSDFEIQRKTGVKSWLIKKYASKATQQEIDEFNRIDWKVGDLAVDFGKEIVKVLEPNRTRPKVARKDGTVYYTDTFVLSKPTPEQIEEFNKPAFKKGDYVVLVLNYSFSRIGDMAKVKEMLDGNQFDLESVNSLLTGKALTSHFRLATKEEIAEATKPVYKAGDWMIVTKAEITNLPLGHVFQLDDVRGNELHYTGVESKSYCIKGSPVNKGFRHATPEEIKKANEPKDGDVVISKSIGNKGKLSTNGDSWKVYRKNGEVVGTGDYTTMSHHWRKATPEEAAEFNKPSWKDGDVVVLLSKSGTGFEKGSTVKITTVYDDGSMTFTDKKGESSGSFKNPEIRLATRAEVEQFNRRDYVEMTVGSRNAKIKVYKDKVTIEHNQEEISIEYLKKAYAIFVAGQAIGDFNIYLVETAQRIFRIGCTSENNLVSLNEIKSVLDAAGKL